MNVSYQQIRATIAVDIGRHNAVGEACGVGLPRLESAVTVAQQDRERVPIGVGNDNILPTITIYVCKGNPIRPSVARQG